MSKVFDTVRSLVALMHARERNSWATHDDKVTHYSLWEAETDLAREVAKEVSEYDKRVIEAVLDGMLMQERRENGELHLQSQDALPIWHKAKLVGEAYVIAQSSAKFGQAVSSQILDDALAGRLPIPPEAKVPPDSRLIEVDFDGAYQVDPALASHPASNAIAARIQGELPEAEAVGQLKKRAESMTRGLRKFGIQLKHGQALRVVASMEGHTSFEALRRKLDRHAPNFCPHCGAAGTLQKVDTVFCEQGEYDGRSHEAEGEGVQYACTQCRGQFNDWSGL